MATRKITMPGTERILETMGTRSGWHGSDAGSPRNLPRKQDEDRMEPDFFAAQK
ncbi:MAG: hypothetical protein IJU57_07130 [Clostridia bacterium]|nr:hypothetical protein [Clostridia bacterium]